MANAEYQIKGENIEAEFWVENSSDWALADKLVSER